jgi:O-antigen/teichoic acid export membrane protein
MIKELIKDLTKYLPSQITPAIVGLIALPIITRLFPPEDYGNYVLVMATVSVFSTIAVGWLCSSTIRFFPAYKLNFRLGEFHSTVVRLAIISVVAISLLFLGILFFLQGHISTNLYSLIRIGILVFIVTSCSDVLLQFLRAKRQVTWYTSFSVWRSVTALGFGVGLVIHWHYGVEGLLWGSVLSMAVALPLLAIASLKGSELKAKGISISLTSDMARYGFPLGVGSLAAWILSLSDRYIIEFFWSSHEVGIYSVGYALSEQSMLLIASLFWMASVPIEMSIWEGQGERASQEFLSKLTRYYLLMGLPAAVGLSVLAKPIITVFAAPQYYEGYIIIPLVAFGAFLLGLQRRFSSGLTFYKKTNIIMFCIIASGLLNIGLNFLLVPRYGYMAAASTTLASYAFLLMLMVITSRHFFVWEFPFKSLGKISFASAIMGMVIYYAGSFSITSSTIANLILSIFLGICIYSILLFLLGEINKEEIQKMSMLKQKIWR